MTVGMACGHTVEIDDTAVSAPQCPCGERRVSRVSVRAPRFRGALGPCGDGERLPALAVTLGPPLKLKES